MIPGCYDLVWLSGSWIQTWVSMFSQLCLASAVIAEQNEALADINEITVYLVQIKKKGIKGEVKKTLLIMNNVQFVKKILKKLLFANRKFFAPMYHLTACCCVINIPQCLLYLYFYWWGQWKTKIFKMYKLVQRIHFIIQKIYL